MIELTQAQVNVVLGIAMLLSIIIAFWWVNKHPDY
jgi:hypothetical protein